MSWFAVTKNQKKIGSLAHVVHFISRVKQITTHHRFTKNRYYDIHYFYDELDRWDRPRVDSYMSSMIQAINEDIETTRKVIHSRLSRNKTYYDSERQYRMAIEKPMVELFQQDKIPEKLIGFDSIDSLTADDIIQAWKSFRAKYPEFCKIYLTTHPIPRYVQLIKSTTKRSRW